MLGETVPGKTVSSDTVSLEASRPRPYVVGLTGGIGSGKSSVADRFAEFGVSVVDTDRIAHQLTGPQGAAMAAIAAAFGAGLVTPEGALDRAAMRALVFANPARRQQLEFLLHPLILAEADRQCAEANGPYVLLVVPLLLESGNYRQRCDRVLVVDCAEATQVRRVAARSGLSETEVRAIMAAQIDREARRAAADDLIENDGGLEALEAQIFALHRRYLELARKVHKPS